MPTNNNPELLRLQEDAQRTKNWKRWGPYLSERQWGTVREDYSSDGDCWNYFPHDLARSRAYRWGEDGLLGITDRECRLCFALALWNGKDPILKERLFGLTGPEGNHGEDVKEAYFYLDSTPTHSYMKALYKYPQAEFPYAQLVEESKRRTRDQEEFELADTGVFDDSRYFDVFAEYAKAGPDDILIRITIANRAADAATIHLLPTFWFRNCWSWGHIHEGCDTKPSLWYDKPTNSILTRHPNLEPFRLTFDPANNPQPLFTENETNKERCFNCASNSPFVKDAFHERVIHNRTDAVNPALTGTKAAVWYTLNIPVGGQTVISLRLAKTDQPVANADQIFSQRKSEADAYHESKMRSDLSPDRKLVVRQAHAGLLWSKQFYHYIIEDWLKGDPAQPPPPPERLTGRNHDWSHLYNRDVISMPDNWEYPWYATWDLAFQMIPMATIDPDFAKSQLLLFLREWYMHPNGQLPAYEFAFGDVNPPVHAWACWRVYKMTGPRGSRDVDFLARTFQKLLINFTWWVNRKDVDGRHIFAGGFLGLDNIGLFDRSKPLPNGARLDQADGTAWMAFFCATMLAMALELATHDPCYEDVASKFFEHFIAIVDAMNSLGGSGLWDEQDGFYYDQLRTDGHDTPIRVRSIVGIIPLFACEILDQRYIDRLPGFAKRMKWFLENRKDLARHITYMESGKQTDHFQHLLAIPSRDRLTRVLRYVLDENEFLSPHGVRSLSAALRTPYNFPIDGHNYEIEYDPAESRTGMFGGNSNWRGPVWFPINYLLVETLERYHHFYGDSFQIECPTGSGKMCNLQQVAGEIARRLTSLFLPDQNGVRPFTGHDPRFTDENWKNLILFHEYFHADTGKGLGASHQTGWTALAARLIDNIAVAASTSRR
jgi:hypothetical protein